MSNPTPNSKPMARQQIEIINVNSIIDNYTHILFVESSIKTNISTNNDKLTPDYGKYFPVINYSDNKNSKYKSPLDQKMALYDINKKTIISDNYNEISKNISISTTKYMSI